MSGRDSRRLRFAFWLMHRCYWLVERVDRRAVPKVSPWAFTFERGRGAVINTTGSSSDRRGARLMYSDDVDYGRAWSDSRSVAGQDVLGDFLDREGLR
ncbi:hypothetical protein [Mycolicibacterium sp.]|uniref:hypothetical protein n=1 Tax=Mycolicibacterium sp. TaxID=2320850 RepID=UPI00355CB355